MTVASESVPLVARPGRAVRRFVAARRSGPWTPEATGIAVVTGLLLLLGLLMSFSASVVDAAEGGDPFGILRRQAAWAAVGVPMFFFVAAVDHRLVRRFSGPLMLVAVAGLVAVLIPGLGVTRGGATRWIGAGPFVIQPSEVAKLATLVWLAHVIDRRRRNPELAKAPGFLLVPAVPLLAVEALLIMMEPDLGTTVLLAVIVGLVLFVEGMPLRLFALFGGLGVVAAGIATLVAPYRMARITGWLDPEADPMGSGYQLLQSLYAMAEGGIFGSGIGSSRGKWNWVPNPETDFVFAIIGEELGLIGALAVIGLFSALLVLGLRVAHHASSAFSRTVAFGITGWLVGQALINIGTVVGLVPITGMTLPLVSAGGSSLVATLVALGILVAIARDTNRPQAIS
jgi:cell division protein FtsW